MAPQRGPRRRRPGVRGRTPVPARRPVDGRVLKVSPTHAFFELEPGIEGVLDVQDYDGTADLSSVLKPNDVVKLRVKDVDVDQHQISLTIR